MTERFIIDNCGTLIDKETRTTYDYVSEVCPLLNEQDAEIKRLKKIINENNPVLKEIARLKEIEKKYNDREWETFVNNGW